MKSPLFYVDPETSQLYYWQFYCICYYRLCVYFTIVKVLTSYSMITKNKIYQGSSKILYQTDEEHVLTLAFTDKVRLYDNTILDISGKGIINNAISAFIMKKLDLIGIDNHFIDKINMREQIIQFVDVLPIQVLVSSIACGRYVSEFGMEEGYVFDSPIVDYRIKNKELKYPIINEHQIINFGWMVKEELSQVKNTSIRVFDFLTGLFAGIGIRLVSCSLEFGRVFNGEEFILMLTDEITPDSCRLWDMYTNEKLGIEAIIANHSNPITGYQLIINKLNI